jgi:hypothetical protein
MESDVYRVVQYCTYDGQLKPEKNIEDAMLGICECFTRLSPRNNITQPSGNSDLTFNNIYILVEVIMIRKRIVMQTNVKSRASADGGRIELKIGPTYVYNLKESHYCI